MSTKRTNAKEYLKSRVGPLTIGKFLYSIRVGEEMSQVEFARKLGISKSHLCDIEQDRKSVSLERAAKFAKVLGYSKEQFVCLAIQGILKREGLRLTVSVKAA